MQDNKSIIIETNLTLFITNKKGSCLLTTAFNILNSFRSIISYRLLPQNPHR